MILGPRGGHGTRRVHRTSQWRHGLSARGVRAAAGGRRTVAGVAPSPEGNRARRSPKGARGGSDFDRLLARERRHGEVGGRGERARSNHSEIKIGQTMPYTGPGAWLSSLGLAEKAYMQMINDQGGINGRKINLISVDDGFLTWRTGNETRKLIDVDHVAFTFGSIGTPTQLEVAKYLNERKIPQLFIESGAYRWGDYKATPYTIAGMRPSNRLGARLYARYILQQDPNPKICILHEDHDYG